MIAQNKRTDSDCLDMLQQNLVIIAAHTATGDLTNLKIQLRAALDAGLSINELKEALTQLYAYCGFPRSLNAIGVFKAVLEQRASRGITDRQGQEIPIENNVTDKYEHGSKVLEILTGSPQPKPAPGFGAFVPRIDVFLKEHLFADIFACSVLSYTQRELVTIAALAAMPGVEPQLQAHIGMGLNTGITKKQLNMVFDLIEKHSSKTQAAGARGILLKI